MFVPFMRGGCLKNYISKQIPLEKEPLLFYLSQLILIIEHIELEGKLYANLTLENIFVESNGYLVLNGLERGVYDFNYEEEDKKLYKILGNPYYFPP